MQDKENCDPIIELPKLYFSNIINSQKIPKNSRYNKSLRLDFEKLECINVEEVDMLTPKIKSKRKISEVINIEIEYPRQIDRKSISDEDEVLYKEKDEEIKEIKEQSSCLKKLRNKLCFFCKSKN